MPLEKQYLADLAVHRQCFGSGDVLFEAGDVGDAMYVVVSGRLSVVVGDGEVATLEAPDFVGEMALIDKQLRRLRWSQKRIRSCWLISHANIYSFAGAHRGGFTWLVVNIAKNLAGRLRAMNETARKVAD